jgi:hypothetical protein
MSSRSYDVAPFFDIYPQIHKLISDLDRQLSNAARYPGLARDQHLDAAITSALAHARRISAVIDSMDGNTHLHASAATTALIRSLAQAKQAHGRASDWSRDRRLRRARKHAGRLAHIADPAHTKGEERTKSVQLAKVPRRLAALATQILPCANRDQYDEIYRSALFELADKKKRLAQLSFAIQVLVTAPWLRHELRKPRSATSARDQHFMKPSVECEDISRTSHDEEGACSRDSTTSWRAALAHMPDR